MTDKQFWMKLDQLGVTSVKNPIEPALSLWEQAHREDLSVLSIWRNDRPYVGILPGYEKVFSSGAFVQVYTDRKNARANTQRVKVRFLNDYLISHSDICAGLMVVTSSKNSFLVPTVYMDMDEEEISADIQQLRQAGLLLMGQTHLLYSSGMRD